jgi:hypothetical protein
MVVVEDYICYGQRVIIDFRLKEKLNTCVNNILKHGSSKKSNCITLTKINILIVFRNSFTTYSETIKQLKRL